MIEVKDIHKSFGALEVLRGINLRVDTGLVTSIVGPSGAGKTTLLQIIGTLSRPDSGKVIYDNRDILTMRDTELSAFRNRNIGFVFQTHRLLAEFSLLENAAMPALIAGRSHKEAFDEARALLTRMGLAARADHKPAELSGGECQRGAVARALINKPEIILADEPTGSLDSENRRRLHALFFELCRELGTTFAIVTHDENLAADSDIVVSMADGRISHTERKKAL